MPPERLNDLLTTEARGSRLQHENYVQLLTELNDQGIIKLEEGTLVKK